MIRHTLSAFVMLAGLAVAACGHPAFDRPAVQADLIPEDRSVLAGEWDYEDGAVVTLRLDAEGNGTYDWKDGRFETTQFGGHAWTGKWYQKENDREGGFVVTLSPDYREGEGRWWYIRIGPDHAPSEKGGTFRLSRKTSLTSLGDAPPVP